MHERTVEMLGHRVGEKGRGNGTTGEDWNLAVVIPAKIELFCWYYKEGWTYCVSYISYGWSTRLAISAMAELLHG